MFGVFGKKPTDEELERAILHAALVAKATEEKTSRLCSDAEITAFLESAYKELGVRPSNEQRKLAAMSVNALLAQTPFFKELLESGLPNFRHPLPNTVRAAMLAAIEKSVSEFQRDSHTRPKQALVLKTYLSLNTVLLSEKLSNAAAKAGIQVFVLGMTDMLSQAENLGWEQFVAIYGAVLSEHKLLPSMPVEEFINKVGEIASKNSEIENVMMQGAQSIRAFVAEHDTNAPTDLFGVVLFAEKNASCFTELMNA